MRSLLAILCLASLLSGQNLPFSVQQPNAPAILRPYLPQTVPPVRLYNSSRLSTLLRAGKLYLTVQDAIALAVENNLGLEINRYGPLLAQSALERAQAGGPLRGVPSASAQVSSVNAGVGVNGSAQSAGERRRRGGNGAAGNAAIQQVGAITPNLDPNLQSTMTQAHLTQPQANTVLSQTMPGTEDTDHQFRGEPGPVDRRHGAVRNYEQIEREFAERQPNPAVGPHGRGGAAGACCRASACDKIAAYPIGVLNVTASPGKASVAAARPGGGRESVLGLVAASDELKARQQSRNADRSWKIRRKEGRRARWVPRAQARLRRRQDQTIALANLRQRGWR